jgi:hypothetical protein
MKKLIYILIIQAIVLSFSGCDYINTPKNHYVSLYNNESDKYITSVYFRDNYYGGERWSRNLIDYYISPYDYIDLVFDEGTYDFSIIMEDDYYSYEVSFYSVYVYENISLDICYDCYDKKDNIKIIKTPKEK